VAKASATGLPRLILSSEAFPEVPAREPVMDLIGHFQPSRLTVVYALRPLIAWATAFHAQFVAYGMSPGGEGSMDFVPFLDEFAAFLQGIERSIEYWSDGPWTTQSRVMVQGHGGRDVVDLFAEVAELPGFNSAAPRLNERTSPCALRILQAINRLSDSPHDDLTAAAHVRSPIVRSLRQGRLPDHDCDSAVPVSSDEQQAVYSTLRPAVDALLAQADFVSGDPGLLDDRGASSSPIRHRSPDHSTLSLAVPVLLDVLREQQEIEHAQRDAIAFWHSTALAYEAPLAVQRPDADN